MFYHTQLKYLVIYFEMVYGEKLVVIPGLGSNGRGLLCPLIDLDIR